MEGITQLPEIIEEKEEDVKKKDTDVKTGRDSQESNEDFIPVATKSDKEIGTQQSCSENAELIRTLSRIGPAEIEKQESEIEKRIIEASTEDETSNLAADIFGRDFAMFAKDHMLMIKPEPEKNTV